jgi:hypothetical protein
MSDDIEIIETTPLTSFRWSWPELAFNVFICLSEATHCVGMFFHETAAQFGKMHNRNVDLTDSRDFADSVMSTFAGIEEE